LLIYGTGNEVNLSQIVATFVTEKYYKYP